MLLREVSFQAYAGQITAFAGLAGAGRTELALAIFGARPITSGRLVIRGSPVVITSPREAMRAGIGYLPEDRKEAGLFLEMSIGANVAAAGLERFGCWWLNDRSIEHDSWAASDRLKVTNRRARAVLELSGGNQQKVMLARWLQLRPPIFIVDEPTRGIDIGAKVQIHDLLRELAREGMAVVLISSELSEVLNLADRILVMREGCLVGEIDGPEATEQTILRLAALPHQTHAHS
jgi:ABC-type sugar transport system ATPase subunit